MLTELKVFNFFHVLCLVIRRLKLCCGLGAGGDGHADLLGVQVVVDEPVNDGGQLGLHQRVAGGLEVGQDGAEGRAQLGWVEEGDGEHLLHELHDLLLGGVAGEELVDVRHHVDADGARQGVVGLQWGFVKLARTPRN